MGVAAESLPTGGRGRLLRRLPAVALLLVILVIWEGAKALFAIPAYQLPHLYEILGVFVSRGGTGDFWILLIARSVAYTAWEALIGFALGGTAGLALAVAFAYSRLLERGLLPYVVASQTVPILAIAPMIVVWLGPAAWLSKAMIAAYLTFFPVTINMLRGFKSVDPDAVSLMRSLAASPRQVFLKLQFPAALPYLFTALRISATASVIGAIVGELPVGSRFGMGVEIINAAQYYNTWPPRLWAVDIVAASIGIGFYHLVAAAERRVVRWRPAGAGDQWQ